VSSEDELGVGGIDGSVLSRFLLSECERVCLGSAKGRVAELRALLRFLHLRGLTERSLAESIPGVAGWRDPTIPATMLQADIERLVTSCDRTSIDGVRDRAMLLLLARLGVRSIEIARLQLDDLDWRAGDLLLRGKARRDDRLPIPADVGDALVEYLKVRGPHESRNVFLTLRAPIRPIRADLVGDVVQRHCRWAGVPHVGPHRLRHTLATRMLAEGATLSDISQVLRHSDLATTAVYAKVDLGRLREVARPWPGVTR
jgi:integrase